MKAAWQLRGWNKVSNPSISLTDNRFVYALSAENDSTAVSTLLPLTRRRRVHWLFWANKEQRRRSMHMLPMGKSAYRQLQRRHKCLIFHPVWWFSESVDTLFQNFDFGTGPGQASYSRQCCTLFSRMVIIFCNWLQCRSLYYVTRYIQREELPRPFFRDAVNIQRIWSRHLIFSRRKVCLFIKRVIMPEK